MSAFIPTIPQPGDFLDSTSQPQLLSNNMALDSVFGKDHYKFSNAVNQGGKHNRVTTPVFITQPVPDGQPPVVIATEPVIAAFQQTAPFGVLQYSYGWSVANNVQQAPSPITFVQSQPTALTVGNGNTLYVMDFAGLPRAIAHLYWGDFATLNNPFNHGDLVIFWNGATFDTTSSPPITGTLFPVSSGTQILLKNTTGGVLSNVYFTMQMLRMQ
jgi:hypothetical protein